MKTHTFVGFGFGPIQAGLLAKEAFQSGNFKRIVVAEIDQQLVDAVRSNGGTYLVNEARSDGIAQLTVRGVELLNPTRGRDREALGRALAEATEIATCLPSVQLYEGDHVDSVAAIIADGLRHRQGEATVVYAAENNNHAAEILREAVAARLTVPLPANVQFLNTVIGKMSRVVHDRDEIADLHLAAIAPGIGRAFLVEQFNRILVSKTTLTGFAPGIDVFVEKDDLLPFEEAKLYGHNAIHALLGFVATLKGYAKMTEVKSDEALGQIARAAFLEESGGALIRKHASLGDPLFTEAGYRRYADDLLERMTNPYLADTVARASRDVVRKLGANDRIFGTMALALDHRIEPRNMALGAMAGIAVLLESAAEYGVPSDLRSLDWRGLNAGNLERLLRWLWKGHLPTRRAPLAGCALAAKDRLTDQLNS
jgi:mannitol-1-phosphate 5-dehydrogenase